MSNFSGNFDVKMGNFEADTMLAGFIALFDAAPIGAQSQCQLGGDNRFPENFDTPVLSCCLTGGQSVDKFDFGSVFRLWVAQDRPERSARNSS